MFGIVLMEVGSGVGLKGFCWQFCREERRVSARRVMELQMGGNVGELSTGVGVWA